MDALAQLFTVDSPAHTVLVYGLVIASGLLIGGIRVFGVFLGVAGVLFSGLIFGHCKVSVNPEIAEFVREFGLILFVYTIGLQVGPAFFSSFKRSGLRLNILAAAVVLLGAGLVAALCLTGVLPAAAGLGIFSGATTNTPSLAASQQVLKEMPHVTPELLKMPGMGYAVCYPFGILGIILTMIFMKVCFRVRPAEEADQYAKTSLKEMPEMATLDLRVENPNLENTLIRKIPLPQGVVISRVLHRDELKVALPEYRIFVGDSLRAVGPKNKLEELRVIVGSPTVIDQRGIHGKISANRILVTKKQIAGKSLNELNAAAHGVTVTRIIRSAIEIPASPEIVINYADTLVVVGEEDPVRKFAGILGNSAKDLDHPQLIPVFVGIALGVVLGVLPLHIPGIPVPVKLGLAGGPLVVAILLSKIGQIGKLVWFMPTGANLMVRELGISLFLASVGLKSGDKFAETVLSGDGLIWMLAGASVTLIPLLIVALYARIRHKLNYLTLCGLLAGSMTDPPALAFANQEAPSSAQVVSYAAVYPLVMLLRVLSAQILAIFLIGR